MPIQSLDIAGYRSIKHIRLRLGRSNVIVGPNGCGKSNLYRCLSIIVAAARGDLAGVLAREGGMPSVLHAGPRTGPESTRLRIQVELDDLTYELVCGLRPPSRSLFALDPVVQSEVVWHGQRRPGSTLLERTNATAVLRDQSFERTTYPGVLAPNESILSQLSEPHRYPELSHLRTTFDRWRFYHQFRTDADSPIRAPQVPVMTPALADDGHDLVAALQTIIEIGDGVRLSRAFSRAFPGGSFAIKQEGQILELHIYMPGLDRSLAPRELSDGTLRYLCLLAALLSPRPPELMAFNEPESSLHPDMIEPLAALLAEAARDSQLWITTHSPALAERLAEATGEPSIQLQMESGATVAPGRTIFGDVDDG